MPSIGPSNSRRANHQVSSTKTPLAASSTTGATRTAVSRVASLRERLAWSTATAEVFTVAATIAATTAPQRNAVMR